MIGLLYIYCRWVAHVEAKRYSLNHTESARTFCESFPPISDEEFVTRCAPGCNPVVAIKVRQIVAEQLNVEYARIHPSSRFIEDLKAD